MERLLSTWYDLLLMKTSIFLVEKGAYGLKQLRSKFDLLNIINIFVQNKLNIYCLWHQYIIEIIMYFFKISDILSIDVKSIQMLLRNIFLILS